MLDIKFLRENPEVVKENIKKKFQFEKINYVDEVIEYDKKIRALKQEAESLRAQRNELSRQIGALMREKKIEYFEGGTIMEKNVASWKILVKFGGVISKVYRIFQKEV